LKSYYVINSRFGLPLRNAERGFGRGFAPLDKGEIPSSLKLLAYWYHSLDVLFSAALPGLRVKVRSNVALMRK